MAYSRHWDRWLDNLAGRAGRWVETRWPLVLAATWGGLLLLAAAAPLSWAAGLYPLAARLYWLFHFICHQEPARSLWIAGHPMAICARDVGLYGGLWVGVLMALWRRPSLPGWLVVMCVLPMALDGGTQLLGLRESTNVLRLVTGGLAGIPTAAYLGSVIARRGASSAVPPASAPFMGERTDGQ